MAPITTQSVILKVLPYRESSAIIYLFSEKFGLVHGIAKGIRGQKKRHTFIERGFLIEHSIYFKPHRDLHTITAPQIVDFFPAIRSDLIRQALRDAAFEMVLTAVTITHPHPELFSCITQFLTTIEVDSISPWNPGALWNFYFSFAVLMGFGFDCDRCIRCGNLFGIEDAILDPSRGGMECTRCKPGYSGRNAVPHSLRQFLKGSFANRETQLFPLNTARKKEITRLLSDYCRYHCDIRREFKTLAFLEQMLG